MPLEAQAPLSPFQLWLWAVMGAALIISVATDLKSRRVLDAVTWPAWGLLLLLRYLGWGVGDAETGLVSGVLASVGAAGLFSVWALRERMGWGDVKLMGVVGAAFGWPSIVAALVFISLVGALQAVASLLFKGEALQWLREKGQRLASRMGKGSDPAPATPRQIPYAVAIALGSAWALWWDSAV